MTKTNTCDDYLRIEHAIHWLNSEQARQPDLDGLAAELKLSPGHVQRLFSRWAGLSPRQFLQILTVGRARKLLKASESVLEASWAAGLSSAGRLHDQMVSLEALSPGEYKREAAGLELKWGVHESPFGRYLLVESARGIVRLHFLAGNPAEALQLRLKELNRDFPKASCIEDQADSSRTAARIFSGQGDEGRELRFHVRGSRFQLKVWQALLEIPPGAVCTYGGLARLIEQPGASRAVGTAVGRNPVAWLIPCHRVIRATGEFGNYRWGPERKQAMLLHEAAELLSRNA